MANILDLWIPGALPQKQRISDRDWYVPSRKISRRSVLSSPRYL